jgi:hypothetical protein
MGRDLIPFTKVLIKLLEYYEVGETMYLKNNQYFL